MTNEAGRGKVLRDLRDKINAVGKAYALEYDGDEGAHVKAVLDSGVDLDDFVMVHAEQLVSFMDALLDLSPAMSEPRARELLGAQGHTFDQVRDAIFRRMCAHTISENTATAWYTFLGLLKQVKESECSFKP